MSANENRLPVLVVGGARAVAAAARGEQRKYDGMTRTHGFLRRAAARAGRSLVESSSRSGFLLVRDLFRKPAPTFRDHALVRWI